MKLIIMIIAVLCACGVTARAEMQQDVINRDVVGSAVNDYGLFLLPVDNGDGYQVNSPDGTKNATWKHDGTNAVFDTSSGSFSFSDPVRLSAESSLPACTSAEAGQMYYYKPAAAPGFMVSCIDNGGLYELVPNGQNTAGFLWYVEEFVHDTWALLGNRPVWSTGGETNHPGTMYPYTDASGTGSNYLSWLSDASTSTAKTFAAGESGWTAEFIVSPDDTADVKYLVGLSSEINTSAPDEDLAIFRFDTNNSDTTWQAVTRDNTTETETVTDTGVTVSVGAWYRLIIVRSDSDMKFYIGTNGGDVSLVATHSTNLPNTEKISPYLEVRESAAEEKSIKIDYFRVSELGLDR